MEQPTRGLELDSLQIPSEVTVVRDINLESVYVRNAFKQYGTRRHPVHVLNGLNMTVPRGAIYGLLGASGCGKTTLLNCIVGRKQLDSGEVWVLGGSPGTKQCGVLGNRLGYMPQEMALYTEFSIQETLMFYGWVAGMKAKKIKERTKFLVEMLMLPEASQNVKNLSTGQQRRVSLAAALIHEPELLILDEPTVGVDPVLRQLIWDHFLKIVSNGNTSVIITTHYIDETRQANLIGLMRKGVLLAEQVPESLISQFNALTLEEVFLKLSIAQALNSGKHVPAASQPSTSWALAPQMEEVTDVEFEKLSGKLKHLSLYKYHYNQDITLDKLSVASSENRPASKDNLAVKAYSYYTMNCKYSHIKALVWKNYLWITSHTILLLFALILPFLQMALFFLCIGHNPTDIRIAAVNYESNNDPGCNATLYCNSSQLSCTYFSYLEKRGLHLLYYDSEEEAVESVLKGKSYASIVVQKNYSDAIRKRVFKWGKIKDWDLKYATVDVVRDVSNKALANYLMFYLYDSFLYFIQDLLTSCNWKKNAFSLPVDIVDPPIYGERYPNFTDFVVPGIIVTTAFMAGVALTAGAMLIERSEGNLDRYFVIGITGIELFAAHGASQIAALIYQIVVTMISAFVIFGMTNHGSYTLVVILQLLTSICGMGFGFVISTFCKTEQTALHIAMGSFVPIIALGGIAWPVEAMHRWLKPLTVVLPLTQTSDSMRSLLHRGWGITHKNVYMGFVSISLWIGIFIIASILCIKYRRF